MSFDHTLSEGAENMLLHIARVRPLPKPFPPEVDGRRHLAELLFAGLIVAVAPGEFEPTLLGREAVADIGQGTRRTRPHEQ